MVNQNPCGKCKGEMKLTRLEPFSCEEHGVKLTVRGMSAMVCGQSHKRFIEPVFAANLMDLVGDPDRLKAAPEAVKKGLFKKHYHCSGCGGELPEAATGSKALTLEAALKHAEPFQVAVELPLFKCGKCGQEHIHSAEEVAQLAFKAIGHGYRAIDIHPE